MKKPAALVISLLALLLFAGPLFAEGTPEADRNHKPVSAPLEEALRAKGAVIIPERFLRGYDPITVFYGKPVGPAGGGPLDHPGDLLEVSPSLPGEFRFLDERTVQFLPAVPWPALKTYAVRARQVSRSLTTLMVPPNALTPTAGSKGLEPLKTITLAFPNEVKTADLAAMISFEVKPLPGVGGTETARLSAGDFTIKMLDKTGPGASNRYQLTLKTPVPYGKLITLSLRLSLDEDIEGSLASYTFATKPEFRLLAMGAGSSRFPVAANGSVYNLEQAVDCGGGRNPLTLEFSEELAPLGAEALKRLVRFEPAVRDLRFEVEGGRLNLFFNADKETPYKFKISYAAVSSLSGRSLMPFGETSFYFYYRQLTAYLQWKSGQAVVERFGPKLFPMQGRGLDRADVRVYKIDPANRNFWPFPADPLAVDEDRLPPMPGEEPDYAENVSAQIRLLGTPHISQIVNLPIKAQSGESHFGLDLGPMLERLSGADAPGTYLVGYRLLGAGSRRVYVRLAVTDLSLSVVEEENAVVFTVTSLKSGQPVAGARITVEGERERDRAWVSVISGATDGQGFFRYSHTAAVDEPVKRIIVSSGDDRLVFDPRNPPPFFANNHWSDEDTRWLSWINSDPRAPKAEPRRRAYLFTERPMYRPEEPVYIMGYVRLRRQGSILADDAGRARALVIHAPGGKQFTQPVALGPNGGFSVKFDRKDLPTGDYSATLQDVKDGALASVEFRKEAYRVPRFELTLSGPDRVPLDREFEVVLTADYYAGGRVVGESVTWEVTKYPYAIRPAGLPGFLFSADESVSGARDVESEGTRVENAVTDADGSARLRLNPAAESSGAPRVYVVEATVRGADTQTVTAVKQVIAVPSFAIGLKLPRFLKDAASIKPEIIIIDHNEKPLSGKLLTVRLYRREWHSYLSETDFTTGEVKYHTDVVDKKIFEKNYQSAATPLALDLPAGGSGVYVVEVLAKDNLGRLQKIQSDLYLAGKEPVSWQKTYANVFETSLDRERYAPGDKATLLLKSPFQDALALVILEGPVKNEYRWVNVRGGQGLFNFTVAENMVPRVPVHALLLRGRIGGQSADAAAKTDRGRPIAMAATTWVTVDSVRNQLKVALVHEKTSLPGRKMKMKILVKDSQGRGVNGTASLWLVDRAVLALGKERPLRPLSAFIDPVYSSLRIAETRNDVVGNLFVEETPGGDEMERAMSKMRGEEAAADRDGKADDLFKKTTVRRNFMTVPYINPAIPVVNGQAEITIDLPDNLTDFSVRCVVAADFDKFGVGTSVVSIRLPVIIQSALPRFVRPGDEFTAGGIGRIVEGAGGPGTVAVEVDNLKLQGRGDRKNDSRPVQWKEKIAEPLYFRFTVPKSLTPRDSATVRLAVERASDKAGDGFELKLPVRLDNPKVRKEVFVRLDASGAVKFPVPDYKPRPGTLKQTVVATYEPGAVKLISAMRYLAEYAHGCTEQRVSKLYPGIALRETLAKLGLRDSYQVPEPVFQELIAYLESTLTPQGLYGAWPGSNGYVWLTAYVVEFLTLARKSGLAVPDKLIERPTKALKEALRSDYDYFISGSSFRERVESLASLGAGGLWDDQYAHDLLAGAFTNDLYTQARILHLFLAQNKGDTKQARELLDLVWSKTVFKLKDKQEVFAGMQYGDFAWGGLVLSTEVRTNAQVIRALRQKEPGSPRVRLMINDLLSRADESGWGSTVDNVSALLAVSSLLEAAPAAGRAHRFEITGSGARQTLDTKGKNVAFLELNGEGAAAVKLVSGDKATAPWLWLSIEYVPDVTGDRLGSENKGFVVERELLEYGADKKLVNRRPVRAGETQRFLPETVVEEHVRVVNPSNRNYVAVVVPFAAGFEPLNPALAGSSKDAIPAGTLTRKPTYALYADEAVTFYYDVLPAGTYDFYFRTRSGFAGSYAHPPARAELMYDLKVYGRSPGVRIVIEEKK